MKTIPVKTQAEFDKLPDSFKEYTRIEITAGQIRVGKSRTNSEIHVSGNATIESVSDNATIKYVYGNATIEYVYGNATIEYVYGNATIEYVYDNATIEYVYGNATIESVYGNATIKYVYGNATIKYVSGNATIESVSDNATIKYVYGNATIKYVYGNATIESVYGNATIESVYGNATIKYVSGNATIKYVYGNATIKYVYDNATIEYVYGNATIKYVYDNATIEYVYGNATIKYVSGNATIESVSDNATIESVSDNATIELMAGLAIVCFLYAAKKIVAKGFNTIRQIGSAKIDITIGADVTLIKVDKGTLKESPTFTTYERHYPVEKKGRKVILYKAVHKEAEGVYASNYNRSFKYKLGETVKHEIDPQQEDSCSTGLHVSNLPWALSFGRTFENLAILECEVPISKIIVAKDCDGKVRCSELKVLREISI